MSEVIRTIHIPVATTARGYVLEVALVEQGPPARWRRRLALVLIRLAGRLARMRVRVVRAAGG
jgi:hypothetical protein